MRAAPWKSGLQSRESRSESVTALKPLWQRFVAQARFSAACSAVP